jgi:hypothetical protein
MGIYSGGVAKDRNGKGFKARFESESGEIVAKSTPPI